MNEYGNMPPLALAELAPFFWVTALSVRPRLGKGMGSNEGRERERLAMREQILNEARDGSPRAAARP